jgi:hypothetical protein
VTNYYLDVGVADRRVTARPVKSFPGRVYAFATELGKLVAIDPR